MFLTLPKTIFWFWITFILLSANLQILRPVQIIGICRRKNKYNSNTEILLEKGRKKLREKEKLLVTSIFSFSHNVSYPSQDNFWFWITFILLSANPFNLDWCKILSFGKELTLYFINTHFDASITDSFWKHCGKRRNCSKRAISPFPTMFSTQPGNCIPICPYFLNHIFICCWIGRGQNWHMM